MSAVPLAQLSSPFSLFFSPLLWPPPLLANPPFNPAFPALYPIPVPVPLPPPRRFLPTTFSAPSDIVALIMVDICRPRATFCSFVHTHVRTHMPKWILSLSSSTVCPHRDRYSRDAFYSGDEAYRALLYRASFSASKARFPSLAHFLFTLLFFFLLFFLSPKETSSSR